MLPPRTLDETLRPFATETQWAYYEAFVQEGSLRKAALLLGRAIGSIQPSIDLMLRNAVAGGWKAPQPEMVVKGVSTLTGPDGSVKAIWEKTRIRGMDREEAIHLADPKKLVSLSTATDGEGRVIMQWAKEKPEDAEREKLWELFAAELSKKIKPTAPVSTPTGFSNKDLAAVYPIGDHHLGMMAWSKETGDANYDMKIAEKLLDGATARLVDSCPPCDTALVAFLGDFLHYDSYDTVTPAHRNLLDADGRYPKMVHTAVRMIRSIIAGALRRHKNVAVIFAKGNHDPSTAAFMTVLLEALYEKEPRVDINTSPMHYHYWRFGKNLVGVTHGDKAKMAQLPAIMAHDQAEWWGLTLFRLWLTGHVHRDSKMTFPGCKVESLEVLPPLDAYASHAGYRGYRSMKALVLHKDFGEIERHTVTPDMFPELEAS